MKYIILFLFSTLIYAEISIDSSGLNSAIDKTTNRAYKYNKERERKVRQAVSNSISHSNYIPCNSSDTCFKLLKKLSNYRYKIQCTKGSKRGETREMCANAKGKWATGCGMSDAFAHHDNTLASAANGWCGR